MNLSKVTLISTCCIDERIESTINAINYCCRNIKFNDVKMFSHKAMSDTKKIKHIKIGKLDLAGYNQFTIRKLNEYVDSDYVLIIQDDGFIVNHKMWSDEFMEYDYIGAYWKWFNSGNKIGNGGFSLRSKRFIDVSSSLDYYPYVFSNEAKRYYNVPEDVFLCRDRYKIMIRHNIKYATKQISERFSTEKMTKENKFKTFGFHGKRNTLYINRARKWF